MTRVRSAGPGLAAVRRLIDAAASRHVKKRANDLSDIAKNLHRSAPRGGKAKNKFGERRSAPGEAPAMETGRLFAEIDQGVEVNGKTATVIVNRKVLEFGYALGSRSRLSDRKTLAGGVLKPRPLGRKASAALKARVK